MTIQSSSVRTVNASCPRGMNRQPFDTGQRRPQNGGQFQPERHPHHPLEVPSSTTSRPSFASTPSSSIIISARPGTPSTSTTTQPFATSHSILTTEISSRPDPVSFLPSHAGTATGGTHDTTTSTPKPDYDEGRERSTGNEYEDPLDEHSLTAALVAALVQTRDGPHPTSSSSSSSFPNAPSISAALVNQSLGETSFDLTSLLDRTTEEEEPNARHEGRAVAQVGEVVEQEEQEHEQPSTTSGNVVTTRSGRRTRPTPGALSTPTSSFASHPTSTSAVGGQSTLTGKNPRVRWTSHEDDELIKLIKEEPPLTWTQMGERLGRPGAGCAMRWYNFIRQSVGKSLADELSNKMRGKTGSMNGRTASHDFQSWDNETSGRERPSPSLEQSPALQASEPVSETTSDDSNPIQPSAQMQVGTSRSIQDTSIVSSNEANGEAIALLPMPPSIQSQQQPKSNETSELPHQQQRKQFPGGYPTTGELVNLGTIPNELLPPPLPPHPSKPGHPFPRPLIAHSNSGPNFLPDQALVKDPPIPFVKNTVIRGRRTHDANSLAAVIEQQQQQQQMANAELGTSTKQKHKKVHPCPAVNCGAAFKRSEHLKRHFKSVHRGEKPFPCKIENCGKSFSRKDNLQQHQAMVHGVRAVYEYSDGTLSVNPPDGDEEPVSITYEAVDITKTARGAARQARQEAKAKKQEKRKLSSTGPGRGESIAKRRRTPSSQSTGLEGSEGKAGQDSQRKEYPAAEEDFEEEEEEEQKEEEEEEEEEEEGEDGEIDFPVLFEARPPLQAVNRNDRPLQQLNQFTAHSSSNSRTPSTVQDLISSSSAASQSFSIGPSANSNARIGVYERRSISAESNERGGRGVQDDIPEEEERSPFPSENRRGSIDKRLRLTGDSHAHDELDPALRALADATTSSIPVASSIAPHSSGLSPLIHHALEQRIVQSSRDIPVHSPAPYPLTDLLQPTTRPFAISSMTPSSTLRTEEYVRLYGSGT